MTLAATKPRIDPRAFTPVAGLDAVRHSVLLLIVVALGAVVYAQFQFWKLPTTGDHANWDYMSQVIVRGGVPYRDAVNHKSPLAAYIGAAAIGVSQPFGLRDIFATRLAYLLLALLTVALTFQVSVDAFRSRRVAVLAALIMVGFNAFAIWNSMGVQPKTAMVLFGLVTLWAVHRERPFVAGLSGMLSALSWQPGLLFVGVAGLAFSRYLTRWRDSRLVALIAGAAMPLALLIAYFGAAGALRDLYLWNIDFNYRVYGPRQVAEGSTLVGRLGQILARNYGAEAIYFWLALPGLLVALAAVWNRAQRDGLSVRELAPRHAILIAPLIYLAFCMTDIQGGPDLVPLLPFISIFAALALVSLLDVVVSQLTLRWKMAIAPTLGAATFAGMLALVFVTSVADVFFAKPTFTSLEQQERDVAEMMRALRPGDQIFTHDAAAILVLSDVHNASRFFFLQRWMGDYLDMTEPDGFSGWFERLKAERPKVVVLGDRRIARPEAFQTWLDENYAPRDSRPFRWSAIYTQHENRYYLRKEAARNTPADPSGRPA